MSLAFLFLSFQVRNYLIYRTTKVCSILVTIQPAEKFDKDTLRQQNVFTIDGMNGQLYVASVAIIDLDPKPFSKMPKFLVSEKKIASYYAI